MVVLLGGQDRSRWDHDMICVAEYWLTRQAEARERLANALESVHTHREKELIANRLASLD